MKFSIIIPAYNEAKNLEFILPRLLKLDPKEHALEGIYVVDSGSKDESLEVLEKFSKLSDKLIILREEKRNGKASAINKALEITRADVVIVHSADCYTDNDSLIELVNAIKEDVGAAMLSCSPILKSKKLADLISYTAWELSNECAIELSRRNSLHHLGNDIFGFLRRCVKRIPEDVINDDAYIALIIKKSGYKIKILENHFAKLSSTSSILDFIRQRERIILGHRRIKKLLGESSTTLRSIFFKNPFLFIKILLKFFNKRKALNFFLFFILLEVELFSTLFSFLKSREEMVKWPIAFSTKDIFKIAHEEV